MRSRIIAAALTGLAAATLALGIPAQASAATGGGCSNVNDGFINMSVCISANGSYALPDLYINSIKTPCQSVQLQLWQYSPERSSGPVLWSTGIPCKTGHYGPWHWPAASGYAYESVVNEYPVGYNLVQGFSPILHF